MNMLIEANLVANHDELIFGCLRKAMAAAFTTKSLYDTFTSPVALIVVRAAMACSISISMVR